MCVGVKKKCYSRGNCGICSSEFFFFNMLSELIVKCVMRYSRFVRILEDGWKWQQVMNISNVQRNRVPFRLEGFLSKQMGLQDLVIWVYILSYLECNNISTYNSYLKPGFLHITYALCWHNNLLVFSPKNDFMNGNNCL